MNEHQGACRLLERNPEQMAAAPFSARSDCSIVGSACHDAERSVDVGRMSRAELPPELAIQQTKTVLR